jgi:hypothetical protein
MRLSWAPALLLVVAVLAGCATRSASSSSGPDAGVNVSATETTGVIKGVVVDAAIKPLAQVLVSVKAGGKTITNHTNANGGFGFSNLEPGTYFVFASKAGFIATQKSAEVKANDDNPPTLRISLEADKTFVKPYYAIQKHVGYIECTTSVLVLCGAPNLLTGQQITPDAFTWDQFFGDNATMIQSEMTWESSQALSPELYFEMELLDGGCKSGAFLNNTSGPSPIMTRVYPPAVLEKAKDAIGTVCPIYYSVFSGGVQGTPVGVTFEQKFEMIMVEFHGFLPPKDYRFTRDGEPKVPPS